MLVDDQGNPTGTMDKLAAHTGPGALHSAFSVFLYDTAGRVLLQKRAAQKHHFRNKWSNTCCSHPLPGESVTDAASRRLFEEVGITATAEVVGSFMYRAPDAESGLIEVEFDYVLIGEYEGEVAPNPTEVSAVKWVNYEGLQDQIAQDPEAYTPWLRLALELIEQVTP
ncbi:MAG: isopentenyl-diphosphate Delta-isomerase [Microthrixaceae bacterium]